MFTIPVKTIANTSNNMIPIPIPIPIGHRVNGRRYQIKAGMGAINACTES